MFAYVTGCGSRIARMSLGCQDLHVILPLGGAVLMSGQLIPFSKWLPWRVQWESRKQLCKLVASGILGNSCTGMWPVASRSKAWGLPLSEPRVCLPSESHEVSVSCTALIENEASKFAFCCIRRSLPLDYLHWKTTFSVANQILPLPQFIEIRVFVGGARKSLLQIGYLYTNNWESLTSGYN